MFSDRKRDAAKKSLSLQERSNQRGTYGESSANGSSSSGLAKSTSFHAANRDRDSPKSGSTSVTQLQTTRPAGMPSRTGPEYRPSFFNGSTGSLSAAGLFNFVKGSVASPSQDKAKAKSSTLPPIDVTASLPRSRVSSFKSPLTGMGGSMRVSKTPAAVPQEFEVHLPDVTLTYGHYSFQGARDYQEDTVACLANTSGHPQLFLGGVFDGHGGDNVSKELERVLLHNMNRKITEALSRQPDDLNAIRAAITTAYTSTNEDISQRGDGCMEAGSCAVTATVMNVGGTPYLVCANAGDCRAVLYTSYSGMRRAVRMSEDHKPQPNVCPSEITRVLNAGGCVLWGRVQGCLAVSRAFGDRTLQPYVIVDPFVEHRKLDPDNDMFFYLASDGVTDMVDDHTGCQVVADHLNRGMNATQAAAALVNTAYQKGSCDNISVLVVRIRRRQPSSSGSAGGGG